MKTISTLALLLLFAPIMSLAQSTSPAPEAKPAKATPTKSARLTPEQVHRAALVIDTHEDTPQRFLDEHFDLADPLNGGQLNLDAIHKGNLGADPSCPSG